MESATRCALAFITVFLLLATEASGADLPQWAAETKPANRRALVLGIENYTNVQPLTTPIADAENISRALSDLHFDVTRPSGAMDRRSMLKAITNFFDTLEPGDLALVYYSGHGVERDGANYLLPTDVPQNLEPGREGHQAISLDWLMDELKNRDTALSIVILDACRNDPFVGPPVPGSVVGAKGLAAPAASTTGLFIGFAAAPGTSSWSGLSNDPPGLPSIFTRQLVLRVGDQGRSLYGIWNLVGRQVYNLTGHKQTPWHNGALFPELKLSMTDADRGEEENAWENAVLSSTPSTLRGELSAFLDNYPVSDHAYAARKKITEIEANHGKNSLGELQLQSGLWTKAAIADVVYTGTLTNAVHWNSDDFDPVFVASDEVLRSKPRSGARVIGSVAMGTPVAVLETPDLSDEWARVLLPDGTVGYLSGVTKMEAKKQVEIAVSYDPEMVLPADPQIVQNALADLADDSSRVLVAVGPATAEFDDRAKSLVYLRAVALRGELIRNGIAPDRIGIYFTADDALEPNAAQLKIIR